MKNFIIFAALSIISLFFKTAMCQAKNKTCTFAWVKEISIEKEEGRQVENFIGIFTDYNDTTIIYKLTQDDVTKIMIEYCYTSTKNEVDSSITFYYLEDKILIDSLKVTFGSKNKLIIGNDIYTLNNNYYKRLQQKIFLQKSILSLAFLTRDK